MSHPVTPVSLASHAGSGIIHIINASDFSDLRIVDHVKVPGLNLADVEVCGDGVFIAYANEADSRQGGVLVYRKYASETMTLIRDISSGSINFPVLI